MNKIKTEDAPKYFTETIKENEDKVIERALEILAKRIKEPGVALTSPDHVKDYLILSLAELDYEVFMVLFIDNRNNLIAAEQMFRGTINSCSIYPRVIAQRALELNAISIILAHNHPSHGTQPSYEDKAMTNKIKRALELLDIQVLDHLLIAGVSAFSFAEFGIL